MFVMVSELSVEEIQAKLNEPFRLDEIEWRTLRSFKSNNGKAFAYVAAYVDSRAIMNRLDNVLGIGNWEDSYEEIHNGILCRLTIHLPNGKTITKSDGADLTDFEAIKGGMSNALKRAAVHWGIGRYLYELPENRVEIFNNTRQGKFYINDRSKQITGSWNPPRLPSWALPKGAPQGNQQKSVQGTAGGNQGQSNQGQQGNNRREDLLKLIDKCENQLGLQKQPEFKVRIFNRANNTNIDGLNLIRTASHTELSMYYKVLKPIYDLEMIRINYKLEENEFLRMVQTYLPNVEVKNLYSCLFNISTEQLKQIQALARDTYFQRQQAS